MRRKGEEVGTGAKGGLCRAEGAEVPVFSWGGVFHKTLPGLPIYPVLPAGFIRDIKEALLFSSMTRSCVASVAVSPYNPSRNQNHCPGVCSMSIFATCRKENTHGKRSRNARDNTVLIYL